MFRHSYFHPRPVERYPIHLKAYRLMHKIHTLFQKSFFITWIQKIEFFRLNNNYPKVEYSEPGILHDTKNILYQKFVEKYCTQMQVMLSSLDTQKSEY